MSVRRNFSAAALRCPEPGCGYLCKSAGGLKRHRNSHLQLPRATRQSPQPETLPPHPPADDTPGSPGPSPPASPVPEQIVPPNSQGTTTEYHPLLDGTPCDGDGYDLPPGLPPPPWDERAADDFSPFESRAEFEFADFLYREEEMAGKRVDRLSQILAALYGTDPPFADHKDLYSTIDAIQQGDVPWQSFSVTYTGPLPESGEVPAWMTEKYEVWFRSPLGIFERQLANPDFKDEIDWAPKRVFKDGKRQYFDLFSGNWVWKQADIIAENKDTHGAMFVPGVLGSDKTTVSVGTGNTEFYPFYGGIGCLVNAARRAHRDGITVMAFLSIPKTTRDYSGSTAFRKFRRQLFHSSLHKILSCLKPHMTTPRVTRCADGHFRRVIYGLGPYIADYPEQALLASIVQNWCARVDRSHEHTDALMEGFTLKELWDDFGIVGDLVPFTTHFPRADIHELISMDLLHQVIKGTFKDHVVDWVESYIRAEHDKADADRILADIDRRIAVTPPFPGLRHFHVGRGYKQWTGNDSKGLMKVYLPAIAGHVPPEVVQAVADIIEFCHLVRRSVIDEDTLDAIDDAVANFHRHREVFRVVRPEGFGSLPRQHSIVHYRPLIQMFGAPNGLCSSITESKHIKAVKRPYRRTNHNKPIGQILLVNQRLDKLNNARVDFTARGMMDGSGAVEGPTCIGEVKLAKTYGDVHMDQPRLHELIRRFLFDQLNPDAPLPGARIQLDQCPEFSERVFLYNSARAVFYAPSDVSGVGGMHHERIRATKSWYRGPRAIRLCLHAARVRMLFRFKYRGIDYPCALIHWFTARGDQPCPETGMWIPSLAVVHLDCLLRGAHLIGVAGRDFIPIHNFGFSDSLDAYKAFYVNKYADHHAHEIAFEYITCSTQLEEVRKVQ
ncbi:hypothetical protein B0H14DRAFT_3613333, partial [Mycena olivaceomarginata]